MTKPMAFGEKEVGNQNAYFMWVMQRATYSVKGYGRINLSSSKGWERSFYVRGGQFLCWCSEWKGNNEGGGRKDKRRIERKKEWKRKWKKGQRERERRERPQREFVTTV